MADHLTPVAKPSSALAAIQRHQTALAVDLNDEGLKALGAFMESDDQRVAVFFQLAQRSKNFQRSFEDFRWLRAITRGEGVGHGPEFSEQNTMALLK